MTTTQRYQAKRKALGLCIENGCKELKPAGRSYCEVHTRSQRERFRKVKRQIVEGYGGCCVVCDECRQPCLQIDHINNDGAEHREAIGIKHPWKGNADFYRWLIKNNFPKDNFQLLCANCHAMKHYKE